MYWLTGRGAAAEAEAVGAGGAAAAAAAAAAEGGTTGNELSCSSDGLGGIGGGADMVGYRLVGWLVDQLDKKW